MLLLFLCGDGEVHAFPQIWHKAGNEVRRPRVVCRGDEPTHDSRGGHRRGVWRFTECRSERGDAVWQ